MGNEVVAVVDDSVVITGCIVHVVVTHTEACQFAQVVTGNGGQGHQVAAYLAEEDSTVGHSLQLAENTRHGIDGVYGIVQMLLVGI